MHKEDDSFSIRYVEFNNVIVGLAFVVIFLPIIMYFVKKIMPNGASCTFYELTYRPCPFCGVTTDIRNILKGNFFAYKYNILSVPFLMGSVAEVLGRFKLNKYIKRNIDNKKLIKKISKHDFILHIIIFSLIIIYAAAFFIFDLRRF